MDEQTTAIAVAIGRALVERFGASGVHRVVEEILTPAGAGTDEQRSFALFLLVITAAGRLTVDGAVVAWENPDLVSELARRYGVPRP